MRYTVNIESISLLNQDVYQICLERPAESDFKAGQYLDVCLADGKNASFSIASAPANKEYIELHMRHLPDSEVTNAVLDQLQSTGQLEIDLAKGESCMALADLNTDTEVVLVGASTGFAQVKSVVEQLLAEGANQSIRIYWAVRSVEDLYWLELPESWQQQQSNIEFIPVVSEPTAEDNWTGRTGLVTAAISEDIKDFSRVMLLASGSPNMVYALLDEVEAKGMQEQQLRSDVFAYAPRPKQ